jgi:soluble lytic murein transglycosylase-like protein
MKKIIIALCFTVAFLIALLSYNNTKILSSFNPSNHPDVIQVEQMIDKTGATVAAGTKKTVALAIVENARYYGIKPKNLVAIAFVESTFRPNMINSSGDHGICQINWFWHGRKYVKDPKELLNVYKNFDIACRIINENKRMGFADIASYHSFNDSDRKVYAERIKNVLRRL